MNSFLEGTPESPQNNNGNSINPFNSSHGDQSPNKRDTQIPDQVSLKEKEDLDDIVSQFCMEIGDSPEELEFWADVVATGIQSDLDNQIQEHHRIDDEEECLSKRVNNLEKTSETLAAILEDCYNGIGELKQCNFERANLGYEIKTLHEKQARELRQSLLGNFANKIDVLLDDWRALNSKYNLVNSGFDKKILRHAVQGLNKSSFLQYPLFCIPEFELTTENDLIDIAARSRNHNIIKGTTALLKFWNKISGNQFVFSEEFSRANSGELLHAQNQASHDKKLTPKVTIDIFSKSTLLD